MSSADRQGTGQAVVAGLLLLVVLSGCGSPQPVPTSHLFLWAGDDAETSSDFLAVIDATPSSPTYGAILTSVPTGEAGTHPHHTEHEMPASGRLLANGFHAGRTWLFDLTEPLEPRVVTSFGGLAGFSHPHTFIRIADGNVLATFQYGDVGGGGEHGDGAEGERTSGGLVLMDEEGVVIRSGAALDPAIEDWRIYPYAVLPVPEFDRVVSTTTDMDATHMEATSEWVQFWRLSDLTLRRSIALEPGPRGDEHLYTGEVRLLADGRSAYVHTFMCGLYLLRDIDSDAPSSQFVHGFEGKDCGVPVLTGDYWLQTVPDAHALAVLDISDPAQPREVSTVTFAAEERPHWIAIDSTGRRVVMNSGGNAEGNRLFLLDFDPATGELSVDESFRDADDSLPGIDLSSKVWPHGFEGKAIPHGTIFSR